MALLRCACLPLGESIAEQTSRRSRRCDDDRIDLHLPLTENFSLTENVGALLIFLFGNMTTMQSLQYIGRPVFALTLLLMLWSSARQWVRERQLRDFDTEAARDELAALRKWHVKFRIGMLLIAIISMIPG